MTMAGSDEAGPGNPDAPDGEASSPTPLTRQNHHFALRWQAVIIAVITAIAGVLTAWLTATSGTSSDTANGDRQPQPQSLTSGDVDAPSVAITSWTEAPTDRGTSYEFNGTVAHLPDGYYIFVIIKNPDRAPQAQDQEPEPDSWLVSPEAEVLRDNHWHVRWVIKKPPAHGQWIAVIATSGNPDPNCNGCTVPSLAAREFVELWGPVAALVRSSAAPEPKVSATSLKP